MPTFNFWMRPLLNGGTLGRLQRVGEFLFEITIARRLADDRKPVLSQIGLLAGRGWRAVRSGWPSTSSAFGVLLTVAALRLSATGLERRRRYFFTGPRDGETGAAAVGSFSARGELPRARPRFWLRRRPTSHTLASSRAAPPDYCASEAWLDLPCVPASG